MLTPDVNSHLLICYFLGIDRITEVILATMLTYYNLFKERWCTYGTPRRYRRNRTTLLTIISLAFYFYRKLPTGVPFFQDCKGRNSFFVCKFYFNLFFSLTLPFCTPLRSGTTKVETISFPANLFFSLFPATFPLLINLLPDVNLNSPASSSLSSSLPPQAGRKGKNHFLICKHSA